MSEWAILKKGSSQNMKAAIVSRAQARRLLVAMRILRDTPMDTLERREVVKKVNVPGRDDVYCYRIGAKERIVFSVADDRYLIHDIVSFGGKSSAKSLLAATKKEKEKVTG